MNPYNPPAVLEFVAALQEEKSSLLAENQVLMERLNQSDSIEDINSPAGRRHLQLQTQLEQLQEETFRTSCFLLRHSSDKVSKLEGTVEHYKKKLEDMGLLRRQIKLLEEKNTVLMQTNVSLEEELRKANATKGQLETYKRQHENKMLKLAQEGSDNEKIALLQSLLEDSNRRKSELETENREKLQELNNELLKKNAIIDEMEPKYNTSCEFGLNAECLKPCFHFHFPAKARAVEEKCDRCRLLFGRWTRSRTRVPVQRFRP
ncbi:hypothetical protein GOODEAATRI_008507 [Goodea atripinnis]|uniref:Hook C-terminal domain-containing protein n=1 Tax=Goodea atripinnis TaxID=208336 RepID=A0ABV0NSX4_9TELE